MRDDSTFDRDAVDQFYDRQRREILARLDPAASEPAVAVRTRRRVLLAGLAAAAVLILGMALLLRPSPALAPLELATAGPEPATDEMPLDAYGAWPAATEIETEAQGAATVAWLFDLAGQDGLDSASLDDDSSYTEFLAAYGTWEQADEEVVAEDAT